VFCVRLVFIMTRGLMYIDHIKITATGKYEGWNFNSGNYLFTTDTK